MVAGKIRRGKSRLLSGRTAGQRSDRFRPAKILSDGFGHKPPSWLTGRVFLGSWNRKNYCLLVRRYPTSRPSKGAAMSLMTQAVWKRFSYPNNYKQPGVMDLDAIG